MANTFKVLFRGAASLTSQTLYTAPASTTTMITSIIITNTSAASQTYTLSINSIVLAPAVPVPAGEAIIIEPKTAIGAGQILAGLASATSVNFHISGIEVT